MIYKWTACREEFLNEPELICLHIVKSFQVLLWNTNDSKVICLHIVKWFQVEKMIKYISIWSIDEILSGTTTPSQSQPESNGNERILHMPQSSRNRVSPSDG